MKNEPGLPLNIITIGNRVETQQLRTNIHFEVGATDHREIKLWMGCGPVVNVNHSLRRLMTELGIAVIMAKECRFDWARAHRQLQFGRMSI